LIAYKNSKIQRFKNSMIQRLASLPGPLSPREREKANPEHPSPVERGRGRGFLQNICFLTIPPKGKEKKLFRGIFFSIEN